MKQFKKTESVEEFLARGGKVKKLDIKKSNIVLTDSTTWIVKSNKVNKILNKKKDFKWSENKELKVGQNRNKKSYIYGDNESEA